MAMPVWDESFPLYYNPAYKCKQTLSFTGEWQHWSLRVDEYIYPSDVVPEFSSILVPNVDNVRTSFLIDIIAKQNKVCKYFIDSPASKQIFLVLDVPKVVIRWNLPDAYFWLFTRLFCWLESKEQQRLWWSKVIWPSITQRVILAKVSTFLLLQHLLCFRYHIFFLMCENQIFKKYYRWLKSSRYFISWAFIVNF